jgi:hypothetical protein
VPPGRPGAGGSHVLAMRWVHDLDAFDRLSTEDQERVIGRTKADSVELAPGVKPSTAHIARAETTLDNEEVEIFRRSVPYGSAREYGLYFVGFSAERGRYDRILARMFDTAGEGLRDRLTDFSRPREWRLLLRAIAQRLERARRARGLTRPKICPATSSMSVARDDQTKGWPVTSSMRLTCCSAALRRPPQRREQDHHDREGQQPPCRDVRAGKERRQRDRRHHARRDAPVVADDEVVPEAEERNDVIHASAAVGSGARTTAVR